MWLNQLPTQCFIIEKKIDKLKCFLPRNIRNNGKFDHNNYVILSVSTTTITTTTSKTLVM